MTENREPNRKNEHEEKNILSKCIMLKCNVFIRTSFSSLVACRCNPIFDIFLTSFHRSRAVFILLLTVGKSERDRLHVIQ